MTGTGETNWQQAARRNSPSVRPRYRPCGAWRWAFRRKEVGRGREGEKQKMWYAEGKVRNHRKKQSEEIDWVGGGERQT